MTLDPRHLPRQAPVLAALAKTAFSSLRRSRSARAMAVGSEVEETVAPPAERLVHDWIEAVGGVPARYGATVPGHLFSQWCTPAMAKVLQRLPYPAHRVLNAGCRMDQNAPLPLGEPLRVKVRLDQLDEDERRALVRLRLGTGPERAPEALVCVATLLIPRTERRRDEPRREPVRVPAGARELRRWQLSRTAGLEHALLTGDFNPIHWMAPVARLSGFRSVILQGYGALARLAEALVQLELAGCPERLRMIEVRFLKPVVLPMDLGCFVSGAEVFAGSARGEPANVAGTWLAR